MEPFMPFTHFSYTIAKSSRHYYKSLPYSSLFQTVDSAYRMLVSLFNLPKKTHNSTISISDHQSDTDQFNQLTQIYNCMIIEVINPYSTIVKSQLTIYNASAYELPYPIIIMRESNSIEASYCYMLTTQQYIILRQQLAASSNELIAKITSKIGSFQPGFGKCSYINKMLAAAKYSITLPECCRNCGKQAFEESMSGDMSYICLECIKKLSTPSSLSETAWLNQNSLLSQKRRSLQRLLFQKIQIEQKATTVSTLRICGPMPHIYPLWPRVPTNSGTLQIK